MMWSIFPGRHSDLVKTFYWQRPPIGGRLLEVEFLTRLASPFVGHHAIEQAAISVVEIAIHVVVAEVPPFEPYGA